ncbi:MAG: dihydroorotate dehydrogenase-like protein [Bacteroidales bacterium]|nr:dihydroorotate dehydrogenase-like protein [Bacteroidales bacterium]
MVNLDTRYLGLKFKNPIIVSSSGLSDSVEKIQQIADAGAGGVVIKSLFEEQINHEAGNLISDYGYPEATDYIRNYSKSHSLDNYLKVIEDSKKRVHIPVIASINCITNQDWIGFSRQIEEAGADALELNVFLLPVDDEEPERLEQKYFDIIKKVSAETTLPIVIKISPYFTNLIYMINRFYALGVKGVVLFNRLYEPDINLKELKITTGSVLSTPNDLRQSLRWVSLTSDRTKDIDISASTGVHSSEAAVKLLLAGATTVQVCSVLYVHKVGYLREIIDGVVSWMESHNYQDVNQIRGLLNYRNIENPRAWERSQFMRYFSSHE